MTDVSSRGTATPCRSRISVSGIRVLLIAIGAVGVSSLAHATPLTVSGVYLQYWNNTPSVLFGAGGEGILYGASSVVPNNSTGVATTTNLTTGDTITRQIGFLPGPLTSNFFAGDLFLCTTTCSPTGNNNLINLTGPWTITFQNPTTTPTSISTNISLVGSGEMPFVNSITLSGTSAQPTFSWTPPSGGVTVDGYRIQIWQNNLVSPANSGNIFLTTLPPTVTSYTVQPSVLLPKTTYTIGIEALQTRDGSTTNLSQANISAISQAYSTFQTLPTGTPSVILPTTTITGNQIIYGFNLPVQPGITYYLDPEVATGYIYQTGAGNPNFASVELPDIGNPGPYDLYLWNGSAFVFDTTLAADTVLPFASGGVSEFEVLGIDPALGLDPNNTTAFITGLTFESAGNFTGTMTPVTTDVSGVAEPGSLVLLASGLLGFGAIHRRRKLLCGIPTVSI